MDVVMSAMETPEAAEARPMTVSSPESLVILVEA